MNYRTVNFVFLLIGLAWLISPQDAAADYLGGVTFSHPSPSYLPHGETVSVEIDFKIDDPAGGYIYARPFTLDNPTPGYGASGGFLAMGTGTTTRNFTINNFENVVTHVRIYVRDTVTDEIELEMFVPVRFVFAPHGVFNLQMNHNQHDRLPFGESLVINFDYAADVPDGCKIFARPFTNGTLTPGYSASGSGSLAPSGSYSQNFSFSAEADVTDIRFQIFSLDNTTLLYEIFVPYDIHWAEIGIYDLHFNWPDGSSLHNSQLVASSFIFDHEDADGLTVEMVCMTGGSPSPNYAYQGSGFLAPGGVSVGRTSRVYQGETDVDGMRFWVMDSENNVLLMYTVPVDYHWAPHAVQDPVFSPASPAILSNDENLNMTFDYVTSQVEDVLVFVRPAYDFDPMFGITSSGSAFYPPPDGSGTYYLRFGSGEHIASQMRFQMVNLDQSEILLEHFYDGFWAWGSSRYITPVPDQVPAAATDLGLCFPNPFNPTTTVPVFLAEESHVRLAVYDLRGRLVQTLQDNVMTPGHHVFTFRGDGLSSGAYICRLETPKGVKTQRVTLVK